MWVKVRVANLFTLGGRDDAVAPLGSISTTMVEGRVRFQRPAEGLMPGIEGLIVKPAITSPMWPLYTMMTIP